ncbi:MAG: hypothetical protein H0W70_02900 [Actinobacteria bacterium]|nr:hypothetical protein [Actinomycetota bacterium]
MRRRLSLGALGAVVALALVGVWPALAAYPPTVVVDRPVENVTWRGTDPTDYHVKGHADTDEGGCCAITKVTVTAAPTDHNPHAPYVQTARYTQGGNPHQSFDIQIFPDTNGKYQLTVVATGQQCSILGCNPESDGPGVSRNITVASPPNDPTGIKAALADSKVTVEWDASNKEADLIGFYVDRAVGSAAPRCITTVAADSKATGYKATDDLKVASDGDYKYSVRAIRKSDSDTQLGTCARPTGIASGSVGDAKVTWKNPSPPTTTTSTTAPGAGGAGGTTNATTKPSSGAGASTGSAAASRRPNLSALGSLGVPTNLATPPRAPGEVDPGFNQLLPFQASGGETADDGSIALPSSPTESSGGGNSRTTTLLFIAAGLLASVLSLHVLWLKAQVDRMPLEALVPEEIPLGPLGG